MKVGTEDALKKIDAVIDYCEPHIEQMWAASVVGILLDCSFRDVREHLNAYRNPPGKEKDTLDEIKRYLDKELSGKTRIFHPDISYHIGKTNALADISRIIKHGRARDE